MDWRTKNESSSLIELEQLNTFLPDLVAENVDEEDDEDGEDSSFLKSYRGQTALKMHNRVESFGITEFDLNNPKIHTSTLQI